MARTKTRAEAEREMPNWIKITDDDRLLIGSLKLAEIMHVNVKSLPKWEARGCPKDSWGWWDIAAVIKWRTQTTGADKQGPSTEADKLDADVKLKRAKAALEELKLQGLTNEMMPVSLIEQRVTAMFGNVRTSILGIGDKLLNQIYTQYPELATDAKKVIDHEVKEALRELATTGLYKSGTVRKVAGRPKRAASKRS